MLLMMFLLRQHKIWRKCTVRLFTVARIFSIYLSQGLTGVKFSTGINKFHMGANSYLKKTPKKPKNHCEAMIEKD